MLLLLLLLLPLHNTPTRTKYCIYVAYLADNDADKGATQCSPACRRDVVPGSSLNAHIILNIASVY